MKNQVLRTVLAAAVAVSISGGFPTPASADGNFKRIESEADFREQVVGKKLYLNDNYFTIRKNGTLSGKFGGKTLKGAWAWRDGYFCRTLSTHSKNTDCQLWTTDGSNHAVSRERGKGKSFTYTQK